MLNSQISSAFNRVSHVIFSPTFGQCIYPSINQPLQSETNDAINKSNKSYSTFKIPSTNLFRKRLNGKGSGSTGGGAKPN